MTDGPKHAESKLQQAICGDMEAFAEIFESYRAMIYSIAFRMVGPDDADDVVMNTYLKAWQALPKFGGRASMKTWLYRITSNCAIDEYRGRKRRRERVMPENGHDDRTMEDLADVRQDLPNEIMSRDEDKKRLKEAMSRIDEVHRVTLQLRYSDDMSYADIAAATGVSIGTVMSRLFNGKRKLSKVFKTMDD